MRHRGQNKWSQALKQYASRNPELQKMVAEHLKFGRELKSKLGRNLEEGFSSTDEEEEMEGEKEEKKLSRDEIMKLAAEEAKREIEKEVAALKAQKQKALKEKQSRTKYAVTEEPDNQNIDLHKYLHVNISSTSFMKCI